MGGRLAELLFLLDVAECVVESVYLVANFALNFILLLEFFLFFLCFICFLRAVPLVVAYFGYGSFRIRILRTDSVVTTRFDTLVFAPAV